MLLLKNGFLEKIETWHVGLSCQYTHFMSFSSKSEHVTVADQATLIIFFKISWKKFQSFGNLTWCINKPVPKHFTTINHKEDDIRITGVQSARAIPTHDTIKNNKSSFK